MIPPNAPASAELTKTAVLIFVSAGGAVETDAAEVGEGEAEVETEAGVETETEVETEAEIDAGGADEDADFDGGVYSDLTSYLK